MGAFDNVSRHHDLISFGEVECCAMNAAFKRKENAVVVRRFCELFPSLYVDAKSEIFADTTGMGLMGTPNKDWLLGALEVVAAEIDFLTEQYAGDSFICGHTKEEHLKALGTFFLKVKTHDNPRIN